MPLDYFSANLLADSHCHLDFFPDLKPIIENAKKSGVGLVFSCSTNLDSMKKHLAFSSGFDMLKICLGVHPVDLLRMKKSEVKESLSLLEKSISKCAAVGEIGLDNKYAKTQKEKSLQEEIFRAQIRIAVENDLPVVVHARFAEEKAMAVLKEEGAKKVLMHWFTNSVESVKIAQKNGFFMSCGPIIHSSKEALSIAKEMPLGLLVLETDAPVAFLGKQSEPSWVKGVAEKLAKERGVKEDFLAKKTTQNALSLFGLNY